jgi:hypothetical protein
MPNNVSTLTLYRESRVVKCSACTRTPQNSDNFGFTRIRATDQKNYQNTNVFVQLPCATARRGTIYTGQKGYPTIERFEEAGVLVHVDPNKKEKALLPIAPGRWRAELGFLHGKRAIHLLSPWSHYYIHTGNCPHHTLGCIIPGLTESQRGVANSTEALSEIIYAVGGITGSGDYNEGLELHVVVVDPSPNEASASLFLLDI